MVFTIFITSFVCFLCFLVASENENSNDNSNDNANDNENNENNENNDDNILIKGHLDAIDAAFNNSETDTWEGLLIVKKGSPSSQPFYSWCKCGAKFKIRAPAKCRPKDVPYPAILGHVMLDGIDNPTSKVIAKAYNKFLEKPFDYLANGFLLWANKKKEKIYARHTRDVIGESQAQCIARAIEYRQKADDGTPFVLKDLIPLGEMRLVKVSQNDENDKKGSNKKRGRRRGRRRSSTVELESSKKESKHGSSRSRRNSKTKKPKVLSDRDKNKEKSVSHDSKDQSSESLHRGDHSHGRASSRRRHSRRSGRRRSSRHRSRGSMDINVRTSTPEKSSSHRASGDRYSPSAFSLAQSEEEENDDNGENDFNMVTPLSESKRAIKLSRRLVFLIVFFVLCVGVLFYCFHVFGVMFFVCFFCLYFFFVVKQELIIKVVIIKQKQ